MGKTIYLLSSGSLSRKDNTIVVENDDGRRFIPVETTDEILVFGEVDLNKRFLEFAAQSEIILHFFNRYGYYVGTYYPREHLNSGAVIIAQARHYLELDKRLALAKRFVHGAISNMEKVISYYARRGKSELEGANEKLAEFKDNLERCSDISELMG
ncbi:MAG: CRISP-associated protein Cas1, partial [Thermovirga sp.]|nr:CRISP-associated protein Cas1 [Thermovirga sp.]